MNALVSFELHILDAIHTLSCPFLDAVMRFVSSLGDSGLFFVALGLALLCFRKTRVGGAVLLTAIALDAICVNAVLKPLVARPRPFTYTEVELLVRAPQDFSFPSGHTAVSFAAATACAVFGKRAHASALVFACLMGFSRLYLYVHFPTDVLAGALVGALCGFAALFLWKTAAGRDIIKQSKP